MSKEGNNLTPGEAASWNDGLYPTELIAGVLYDYLVQGMSKKEIDELRNPGIDQAAQIASQITRAYGFNGTAYQGMLSRRDVAPQQIRQFVEQYHQAQPVGDGSYKVLYPEEELESLGLEPGKQAVEHGADGSASGRRGRGRRVWRAGADRETPAAGQRDPFFKKILLAIAAVVVLALLVFAGIRLIGSGAGKLAAFTSTDYTAEDYEYKGEHYVGNKHFGKPNGLNLRYGNGYFDLGEFAGVNIKGYAVRSHGDTADIGIFGGSKLKGHAIHGYKDCTWFAAFSGGKPNGIAVKKGPEGLQIVKISKGEVRTDDFSTAETLIASYTQDGWIKPNGKPLRMKEDTYKGYHFEEGRVTAGGVSWVYDNGLCFESEVVDMSFNGGRAQLDSTADGAREGVSIDYRVDEELKGRVQSEVGSGMRVGEFTVTFH